MVRTLILVATSVALLVCWHHASAEMQKPEPLPCKLFIKDAEGWWSPKEQIKLAHGGVPITIGPGLRVKAGALVIGLDAGLDLGAALEAECGAGAPT